MKGETLNAFDKFLRELSRWSAAVDQGRIERFSSDDLAEAIIELRHALNEEVP